MVDPAPLPVAQFSSAGLVLCLAGRLWHIAGRATTPTPDDVAHGQTHANAGQQFHHVKVTTMMLEVTPAGCPAGLQTT